MCMYTPTSVKYCDCYILTWLIRSVNLGLYNSTFCNIRIWVFEKHIGDLMINNPFFDKNCKNIEKRHKPEKVLKTMDFHIYNKYWEKIPFQAFYHNQEQNIITFRRENVL